MSNTQAALELLDKLEFLLKGYSNELRKITQPYQLHRIRENIPGYTYRPDSVIVMESLMEHVGSLPVVATTIYPYIDDKEVNLGEALTMLAIHDIGELITGDVMTFMKDRNKRIYEDKAALSLLDPSHHGLYQAIGLQTSASAKYAKAIDKITPDIYDYLAPVDVTVKNFKHYVKIDPPEIVGMYLKYKRPFMEWNPFMKEFHTLLIDKIIKKIENFTNNA